MTKQVPLAFFLMLALRPVYAQSPSPAIKSYCEIQNRWACFNPTSSFCTITVGSCLASQSVVQDEQMKAHAEGRMPEVTPAELFGENRCENGVCRGGLGFTGPEGDCGAQDGASRPQGATTVKSLLPTPFFSIEAVYRVQNGTKVQASSQALSYPDVQAIVKAYKTNRGIGRISALSEDNEADFKKYLQETNPGLLDQFEVINLTRMMAGLSEARGLAMAEARGKSMTFSQKTAVLASVLAMWSNHYDNERTDKSSERNNGSVSIDAMYDSVRDFMDGKTSYAGVCRDMHAGAARIAIAMGIKDAFAISYKEGKSGHVTLVVQDPDDRRKIYKINYGNVFLRDGCVGPTCLDHTSYMTAH